MIIVVCGQSNLSTLAPQNV